MFVKYKADILVCIHFLLGIIFALAPSLVFYFTFLFFLYGIVSILGIVKQKPAYLFAAYLVGFELLGRMSQTPIPHEFTKYAVSLLFFIELVKKGNRPVPWFIVIYALCLIPAIFLIDAPSFNGWRKLLSFNLSGPLCLIVSTIYFFRKKLAPYDLRAVFLHILWPLIAILAYLITATPNLSEIEFGYQSNFTTSIYGPNQMASILGLGILIIGICYLFKIRLLESSVLGLVLISLFAFRGLLTFSRGGMIAPVLLLFLAFLLTLWKSVSSQKRLFRTVAISLFAGLIFYFAFSYTNDITGNALYNRYTGKIRGKQIGIERLTSGRTEIANWDLKIFEDNVVTGVGVGMAKFYRKDVGSRTEIIAHNEYTRLLAEHGLFGAVALLILFLAPAFSFFKTSAFSSKVMILTMAGFCLIFMTHSATRIAAPCFLFGLAFVEIINPFAAYFKFDFK